MHLLIRHHVEIIIIVLPPPLTGHLVDKIVDYDVQIVTYDLSNRHIRFSESRQRFLNRDSDLLNSEI